MTDELNNGWNFDMAAAPRGDGKHVNSWERHGPGVMLLVDGPGNNPRRVKAAYWDWHQNGTTGSWKEPGGRSPVVYGTPVAWQPYPEIPT